MNSSAIAKWVAAFGLAAATVGANGLVGGKTQMIIGIIAAGCAACGSVIKEYKGHLAVTILGIVVALAGAIGPQMTMLSAQTGKWVVVVGAVAAVLGKGLWGTNGDQ